LVVSRPGTGADSKQQTVASEALPLAARCTPHAPCPPALLRRANSQPASSPSTRRSVPASVGRPSRPDSRLSCPQSAAASNQRRPPARPVERRRRAAAAAAADTSCSVAPKWVSASFPSRARHFPVWPLRLPDLQAALHTAHRAFIAYCQCGIFSVVANSHCKPSQASPARRLRSSLAPAPLQSASS
jgi:hypothetical protein